MMPETTDLSALTGAVTQIINFSAVDGPGNRMAVFLPGCYFNCWYCHNPETIALSTSADPSSYRVLTVQDIVDRYLKAKPFVSGVTFSGGECTIQIDFLLAVCKALKTLGANILIDTNGQLGGTKLQRLFEVTDGLMLDIKAIDPEEHRLLTGVDNDAVLRSFYRALQQAKLAEVRTVIRGDVPDALNTVAWVARELVAFDADVPYRLIRYREFGVREQMRPRLTPPSQELMAQCQQLARDTGLRQVLVV